MGELKERVRVCTHGIVISGPYSENCQWCDAPRRSEALAQEASDLAMKEDELT